jgi:hypothetical protein
MNGSLTITLDGDQIDRILRILGKNSDDVSSRGAHPPARVHVSTEPEQEEKSQTGFTAKSAARELGFLLSGRIEQLVRFITAHHGELYNDDLARELGFDNPAYTSSLLGKVTGKLRRVGIQAEGRNGMNWYSSRRVKGRTLLRVRPDVLKVLEEAAVDIPR